MRLMLGISILVSLSPTLSAKEPALVPSEQGKMRLLAPSGWTVSVDESQGVVVFARDPAKADAPILLLVAKDSGTVKEDELIDTLVSSAGAGFKVIDRGRLSSGGLQLVEEGKHQGQGMTLRLGAVVLEHEPHILVGLLLGKPGDFADVGGVKLVVDVISGWLQRNAEAAPAPAPTPSTGGLRQADMVGKWSTSAGTVTGTQAGARVSAGGTTYTMRADGKYEASFAGISGGSIWRNTDKGTWSITGGRLVLKGKERTQKYRVLGAETLDDGRRVVRVIDDQFGPDQEVWWTESWVREP